MTNLTQLPITPRSQVNAPHDEQRIAATNERRAAALADVQQMQADLIEAQQQIAQLKADLHREEDRCVMLADSDRRNRAEALVFRTKLTELATDIGNIALITIKAQEFLKTVYDLTTQADTPSEETLTKMEQVLGNVTLTKPEA